MNKERFVLNKEKCENKPLLKAELFVYGAKFNEQDREKLRLQNPYNEGRAGLSAGRFIEVNGVFVVNIPFWEPFVENSPFQVIEGQLYKNGVLTGDKVEIIPPAPWLHEKRKGVSAGQIIQLHGKRHLATMLTGCDFGGTSQQCKFCGVAQHHILKTKPPEMVVWAVREALKFEPNYSLSINMGTLKTEGRGMELLVPTVAALRQQFPSLRIGVEIAPPKTKEWFYRLEKTNNKGDLTLMMNLNFWNEKTLSEIESGKDSLISKADYFWAWNQAVEIFGIGRVSSCILAGIESEEETKMAIDALTSEKVLPEIILYRPITGRPDNKLPSEPGNPLLFLRMARYAVKKARENGLVTSQTGCIDCGGCSLTTIL